MRNELEPKLREGRRDEKGLERGNRTANGARRRVKDEKEKSKKEGQRNDGREGEGEKKNEEERRREREEERKKCLTRAMHNGERRNPLAGVP